MSAFWNGTPNWWFNMYIGGSTRACANTNLSGDWINQVRGIGWKLLPTWTGAQSPCTDYSVKFSLDPSTAYSQGYNEAVAAYQQIRSLGMDADTPIALDVEGFDNGRSDCVASAQSFIAMVGPTTLHLNHDRSRVYTDRYVGRQLTAMPSSLAPPSSFGVHTTTVILTRTTWPVLIRDLGCQVNGTSNIPIRTMSHTTE